MIVLTPDEDNRIKALWAKLGIPESLNYMSITAWPLPILEALVARIEALERGQQQAKN